MWTYAIDPIAISPKLCISIDFPVSPHSERSISSEKSKDPREKPTAWGKTKDSSVKPQNVVGIFNGTQCPLLRQTGHRSLCTSPFSIETPFVHRVVHRSWGTAYQCHLHSIDSGDRTSETGRVRGSKFETLGTSNPRLQTLDRATLAYFARPGASRSIDAPGRA